MNRYNQEDNSIKLVKGTSIGSGNWYRAKLVDSSGREIASTKVNFTTEGDAMGSKAPCFFVELNNVLYININGKYMPFRDDSAHVMQTPDGYVIECDYKDETFSAVILEKDLDILSQDEDYMNVRFEVGEPRYLAQEYLHFSHQVKVIDAESGEDIGVLDDRYNMFSILGSVTKSGKGIGVLDNRHNTFSILGDNDIFLIINGKQPIKYNQNDISRLKVIEGKYVLDVNNQCGNVPERHIEFSDGGKKMVDSHFHRANSSQSGVQNDQTFDVNKFVDLIWDKIFDGTLNAGTSHGIALNSRVYYGEEGYQKSESHQITEETANQILDDSGIHYILSNIDLNALI